MVNRVGWCQQLADTYPLSHDVPIEKCNERRQQGRRNKRYKITLIIRKIKITKCENSYISTYTHIQICNVPHTQETDK